MLVDGREDADRKARDDARERGVRGARAFAARLEEEEAAERQAIISRGKYPANGGELPSPGSADDAMILRLKSENEGLRQFRHAVVHSKGWLVLQLARRLVGRAW